MIVLALFTEAINWGQTPWRLVSCEGRPLSASILYVQYFRLRREREREPLLPPRQLIYNDSTIYIFLSLSALGVWRQADNHQRKHRLVRCHLVTSCVILSHLGYD